MYGSPPTGTSPAGRGTMLSARWGAPCPKQRGRQPSGQRPALNSARWTPEARASTHAYESSRMQSRQLLNQVLNLRAVVVVRWRDAKGVAANSHVDTARAQLLGCGLGVGMGKTERQDSRSLAFTDRA